MSTSQKSISHITDVSGQTNEGTADLLILDSSQRLLRSLKRAGIFFGIAVVSILVPMLHFVLVPAFLIVSGVFFAKTMGETKVVTAVLGSCPSCKQGFELRGVFKATGTKETCPHCRQLLKISFES